MQYKVHQLDIVLDELDHFVDKWMSNGSPNPAFGHRNASIP